MKYAFLVLAILVSGVVYSQQKYNYYRVVKASAKMQTFTPKKDSLLYTIHGKPVTKNQMDSVIQTAIKETMVSVRKKGYIE